MPARNFQWPPSRPTRKSCFFCCSKIQHPRDIFPAQGQTCSYCHKLGHFSSVCQQAVQDQRSSRPLPKKPIMPNPRHKHIRTEDLDESLALLSEDGIQYEHCFTILDKKTSHRNFTHLQQSLRKTTLHCST